MQMRNLTLEVPRHQFLRCPVRSPTAGTAYQFQSNHPSLLQRRLLISALFRSRRRGNQKNQGGGAAYPRRTQEKISNLSTYTGKRVSIEAGSQGERQEAALVIPRAEGRRKGRQG